MKLSLSGLHTALITPFTETSLLDEEGLRKNIQRQLESNVQGIVVLGTTGESATLSSAEKKQIIKIAREEIDASTLLIVGTGSCSTEETIKQTILAEELGADAALVVTPYYNRPSQEGLYQHFSAICQKTKLPLCLYNIPGRTGQNLEVNTVKRLLIDFSSIVAIKESSGQLSQIMDLLYVTKTLQSNVEVLSGDDAWTLPLMALGCKGVISVMSNLLPQIMLSLVDACKADDFKQARHLHEQLLPFFQVAFIETNPVPIKAMMQLCKMAAGNCRLPLSALHPHSLQKIKETLQTLPSAWLSHDQTQPSFL